MSCEYCNGSFYIVEREWQLSHRGDFYPGLDVGVYGNLLTIEGCADTYEPNYIEMCAEINFCPMCGEKLEKAPEAQTY